MRRITVALILVGLAGFTSGCMNGGAVPPSQGAGLASPSLSQPRGDRVRIREFTDLPQYGSGYYSPTAVTAGPGGLLWITDTIDQDFGENAVVAVTTSGAQQHAYYYGGINSQGSSFHDIVEGADGNLWISDVYNEQILKMTPQGSFTGFVPQNFSAPVDICSGPDKALWFTLDSSSPEIGRITTSGRIKLFPISALANDITAGPDSALWFTQPNSNQIGRITTRGKVTEYSKGISFDAQPFSIASGPDGALWFTEPNLGQIGRITAAGKVTEYSKGITPTEKPQDLAAGPDGAMWFTEYETYGSYQVRASKIGRITTQGTINEYARGVNPRAGPTGIAAGPNGRMWFVESSTDRAGRVNP